MSAWKRWRIAIPLLGLSLLLFVPAVFGAWAWWSENSATYRTITAFICLVLAGCVGISLSIGIKKTEDVPWLRIGLVAVGILATCGLAVVRRSV
ncbi:hypothetical protein [Micromonospora sediminimaris]|uniref:Uncharacterized protein n=1 Tax=Micromonospora sediminimaris TaxID=547162 RepID=A0A9W5USJ0_9ACTN|nr:hypothetical protein [Micromonospora sediminimaris]GIJ34994.1 hypothetical protein Vse01_41420 [Micromonospora sediminimaris]SFD28776.1 hypothetical protein SAMN05216284_11494 [Micromonospora sediminimaris]